MKMASFVAGLLATGLFVFSVEGRAAARAGLQGRGFRGGFAGRRFGPAFREAFGRRAPRGFTGSQHGPAFASPHHNPFFARGHHYFPYRNGYPPSAVFAFSPFGLPWWYPNGYNDGGFYEGPSYGVAAVDDRSEENDLARAAQPALVQHPSYQSPGGAVIREGNDRALETEESRSGPTRAGQPLPVTPEPDEPAGPQTDRAMPVGSPAARAPAGAFAKFVLLSWFQEDGKATILVENTETNATQEVTSEANKDNLRIVTIHPSANPNLSEVVISNGMEQGVVKFRPDAAMVKIPQSVIGSPGQTPPEQLPRNLPSPPVATH